MSFLPFFLAGLLSCNCIPHLAAGLRGERFPTPFARPRGVGLSSPVVNFLWGAGNLAVAAWLVGILDRFASAASAGLFAIAFVAAGIYLSLHFGKVRDEG